MSDFNQNNPDADGVYYQSYAAVMTNPLSDIFMFFLYLAVRVFEGENDGLVTPAAVSWTNFRGVLRSATGRGISHADEVDARRTNFAKSREDCVSDIREFYVKTISELREMGF